MKLTKEDYMRLPKERLAELLVERDNESIQLIPSPSPFPPSPRQNWWCDGTVCTNPQMDCINCPRKTSGRIYTAPNTATGISTLKAEGK